VLRSDVSSVKRSLNSCCTRGVRSVRRSRIGLKHLPALEHREPSFIHAEGRMAARRLTPIHVFETHFALRGRLSAFKPHPQESVVPGLRPKVRSIVACLGLEKKRPGWTSGAIRATSERVLA